jgi:hypothetical protein
MDFSKIDMESNVQEGRESDNNIATKSSSYWEKEYNKAKYYYNDYKTNSLLQDMYNMQAEYLVKMSIAAWNLGKKRTAVHHLYNTIDVLENHYGYTSAGAAKMLLKKMEDGTCPKDIPVDIVIGTKTDPITDASICITYGVVTFVMMKANKAQLNQEMEFMRRMHTLGGNTDYVLPITEIRTPMDASQIRCIARLHYLDITHDIFNPNHRPKGDRKKQMMWDMTKIIYDIFND